MKRNKLNESSQDLIVDYFKKSNIQKSERLDKEGRNKVVSEYGELKENRNNIITTCFLSMKK